LIFNVLTLNTILNKAANNRYGVENQSLKV